MTIKHTPHFRIACLAALALLLVTQMSQAQTATIPTDSGRLSLQWNENTEADLDHYNIYRSQSPGGPYAQVNPTPVREPSWMDSGLILNTEYFYCVTAVDRRGNESVFSAEVSASPMAIGEGGAEPTPSNLFADAGADQDVQSSKRVTLDGRASTDTTGLDIVGWLWTQVDGPLVEMNDDTSSAPVFTAPMADQTLDLVFTLTIWNSELKSAESNPVIVTVHNDWPIPRPEILVIEPAAPEGAPLDGRQLSSGENVIFDGSASWDPDGGEVIAWYWIQRDEGIQLAFEDDMSSITRTVTPMVNKPTTFTVSLYVWDENGTESFETASFMVNPGVPVADAGSNQTVKEGDTVTLNGSKSYDVDGELLGYFWVQTHGPLAMIADDTQMITTFEAPQVDVETRLEFALYAFDDDALSGFDYVTIIVQDVADTAPVNQPPVAEAGQNQKLGILMRVTLDGTGSFDPDGDALTYSWRQVSGEAVTLSDPESAITYLSTPNLSKKDTLVFELTVSDGTDSATDTVDIEVQPNRRPIARD